MFIEIKNEEFYHTNGFYLTCHQLQDIGKKSKDYILYIYNDICLLDYPHILISTLLNFVAFKKVSIIVVSFIFQHGNDGRNTKNKQGQ